MLSLPYCTASPAVYLCVGVLPAEAQRDLEILGLLGQLAMCNQDAQNIRQIIEHSLTFYDVNFSGWSGLVRRTCLKYGLPDPLQYLQYPWRADRWRQHCKSTIQQYWEEKFKHIATNSPSLQFVDVESASLSIPMRVWQMAGLSSVSVRQATVVNWMVLGVYFTRELLHKMKKAQTDTCLGCELGVTENLGHFLLHCVLYKNIREEYLPKFIEINKNISLTFENENEILICILDPVSSKLPENVIKGWTSVTRAYELSRQFCFDMHRKREKHYKDMDKVK